jgi:hypothetical protein
VNIDFGKYAGKPLELLVLKEPGYVAWILKQQSAAGRMKSVQIEAKRLIALFNAKPFLKDCFGQSHGPRKATRCSVYGSSVNAPYWWCSTCNPYESGAAPGKLQSVATYESALRHVDFFYGGRGADYKSLIRALAEAKGLPSRVGEKQAKVFLR